jgi:hypothetical protein
VENNEDEQQKNICCSFKIREWNCESSNISHIGLYWTRLIELHHDFWDSLLYSIPSIFKQISRIWVKTVNTVITGCVSFIEYAEDINTDRLVVSYLSISIYAFLSFMFKPHDTYFKLSSVKNNYRNCRK